MKHLFLSLLCLCCLKVAAQGIQPICHIEMHGDGRGGNGVTMAVTILDHDSTPMQGSYSLSVMAVEGDADSLDMSIIGGLTARGYLSQATYEATLEDMLAKRYPMIEFGMEDSVAVESTTKPDSGNGNDDGDGIMLNEVVKVGNKKHQLKKNYFGLEPTRGIPEGDPRIERVTSMRELLHPLGIFTGFDENGDEVIKGDAVGVVFLDNFKVDTDEVAEILRMHPSNVKSIEYFSKNNPQNSLFGVRPRSFTGTVPGALFIFLKDGSEVLKERRKVSKYAYLAKKDDSKSATDKAVTLALPQVQPILYPIELPQLKTLRWLPDLQLDDEGQTSVELMVPKGASRLLVTIEGISNDGQPVSVWRVMEYPTP